MMKKAGHIRKASYLVLAIIVFGSVWSYFQIEPRSQDLFQVEMDIRALTTDSVQVFYDTDETGYFENKSAKQYFFPDPKIQTISLDIEIPGTPHGLRIDPGTAPGVLEIKELRIKAGYDVIKLNGVEIVELFEFNEQCIAKVDSTRALQIERTGEDAYFSTKQDLAPTLEEMKSGSRPVLWPFLAALLIGGLVHLLLRITDPGVLIKPAILGFISSFRNAFNLKVGVALVLACISFWLMYKATSQVRFHEHQLKLLLSATFERSDQLHIFYANENREWNTKHLISAKVYGQKGPQIIEFSIPDSVTLHYLRIDLGAEQECVKIDSLTFYTPFAEHNLGTKGLWELTVPNEHITEYIFRNGQIEVSIDGNDAYLKTQFDAERFQQKVIKESDVSIYPKVFGLFCGLFVFLVVLSIDRARFDLIRERPKEIVLATTFCVLIFLPLINSFIYIEPKAEVIEKRKLADKPELLAHDLIRYPKEFRAYYEDNFGFRKLLVRWNALLKGVGLGVSPKRESVVFGKEGWMYYSGLGVIEQYLNEDLFTGSELNRIQENLEERAANLAEKGIDYYITIAPLKGTIYPEYLPDRFRKKHDISKLDQLAQHLQENSSVKFIDLRKPLLEAKKKRQAYYKTDTHWNVYGAFVSYQQIIQRVSMDHPEIVPFEMDHFNIQEEEKQNADLTNMIGLNDVFLRNKIMMFPKHPFNAIGVVGSKYQVDQFFKYRPLFDRNDSLSGPDLVMFRDSYAVYLRPFISEHFHKSAYIWSPLYHPEVIDVEQPDIVIHELLERFIDDLLLEDPGSP